MSNDKTGSARDAHLLQFICENRDSTMSMIRYIEQVKAMLDARPKQSEIATQPTTEPYGYIREAAGQFAGFSKSPAMGLIAGWTQFPVFTQPTNSSVPDEGIALALLGEYLDGPERSIVMERVKAWFKSEAAAPAPAPDLTERAADLGVRDAACKHADTLVDESCVRCITDEPSLPAGKFYDTPAGPEIRYSTKQVREHTSAVRNAALEEAARACQNLDKHGATHEWDSGTFACAKAIRALRSQPVSAPKGEQQ